MQDNLVIVEHNVATGKITEFSTTKEQLKADHLSPEITARREANAAKELGRKAIYEKLGLTPEEIDLLS